MSRMPETPSRPTTALVMPLYWSGSLSVIQTDSGMSAGGGGRVGALELVRPEELLDLRRRPAALDSVW